MRCFLDNIEECIFHDEPSHIEEFIIVKQVSVIVMIHPRLGGDYIVAIFLDLNWRLLILYLC